ncbi:MAG: COG4223 family protein [Pikeienuella sp.]
MADQDGPKPAKERLEAAKAARAAAQDAEILSDGSEAGARTDGAETSLEEAPRDPVGAKGAEATPDGPAEAAAPEAEPEPEAETPEEAEREEPEPEEAARAEAEHDEHGHRPLSAIILQWLLIFFIGAAAALWAGPKIAPHLPAWAEPVARFLTPGANQTGDELAAIRADGEAADAALKQETEAAIAALRAEIAGLDPASAATAAAAEAVAPLDERIGRLEGAGTGPDQSALDSALDALATRIAALESAALAGEPVESAPAAAVNALQGELAALQGSVASGAMEAQEALQALDARVAALEGGEAATANAQSEAERIRRDANLHAALTRIDEALASGAPFEGPLQDAVSLSGQVAPEMLAALAEGGAPRARVLAHSVPAAARQGYAATMEAEAGDGFGAQFLARLEGRIGGRPAAETPGEDAGAVLSRIEARLGEGRIGAAAREAAGLPEATRAAMAAWLAELERAAAAQAGFAEWRSTLGVN